MTKILLPAAIAASLIVPSVAQAQAVPPAAIAVVDLDRVTNDCTACKTASTALRAQVTALQTRQKSLAAPLQAEQKAIQTAIDALGGKEPDAALKARIKAFQTREQTGTQEVAAQQQQIQRNQQYIQKQILDKLNPIYSQVMQKRGANVLVEVGSTLATTQTLDVTTDVLTALNAAMPTISVVAPATAQTKTPQGR